MTSSTPHPRPRRPPRSPESGPRHVRRAPRATTGGGDTRAGFTLLEVLLVLGVMATLAVLAFPRFESLRDRLRLEESARRLAVELERTAIDARRFGRACEVRFDADGRGYSVWQHPRMQRDPSEFVPWPRVAASWEILRTAHLEPGVRLQGAPRRLRIDPLRGMRASRILVLGDASLAASVVTARGITARVQRASTRTEAMP